MTSHSPLRISITYHEHPVVVAVTKSNQRSASSESDEQVKLNMRVALPELGLKLVVRDRYAKLLGSRLKVSSIVDLSMIVELHDPGPGAGLP